LLWFFKPFNVGMVQAMDPSLYLPPTLDDMVFFFPGIVGASTCRASLADLASM